MLVSSLLNILFSIKLLKLLTFFIIPSLFPAIETSYTGLYFINILAKIIISPIIAIIPIFAASLV